MIEIKELKKSFGEKTILNGFHFTIKDGIMLAITGKSGSGKSTLLNMIGLLDENYDGEILYNGVNRKNQKEKKRIEYIRNNINYLFQNYALVDNETVEYNLLLALEYQPLSKQEKRTELEKALIAVGLEGYQKKKVYTLSGGEQQRISLARMMLKKGDLILADEPTGNLDAVNTRMVMDILKAFQKKGKTVVIVTHNEEIAKECDEIIHL